MFFSVKYSIRIAGKVYMPCICYTLTRFLELTVKDLEKQGKATIYDKMVFFQNGKIIETGITEKVFAHPECDYTRKLLEARIAL